MRDTSAVCSLNHFYVVLDTTTYRAIEADSFLRQRFAPNERRTTVRADQTYTGLYFYGVNTYFEFFDVADSGGRGVTDYGLAFGVDDVGAISTLRTRVGADIEPESVLISRLYEGEQVPWFFMATLTHFPHGSAQSSWVMEYHPEFLARWHPRSDSRGGVQRRDILSRYRDALGERVANPVLEDVIGLTIAGTRAMGANFLAFCTRAGYRSEPPLDGAIVLRGPDIVLRFIESAAERAGVREVQMRTRGGATAASSRRLGHATLHVGDGTATLTLP
jgi:hypothetical protein